MEHSDRCNSFESCDDCYDKYYSMGAVIRELEAQAEAKYIKSKIARLKYNNSAEAREKKMRKFRRKFGIEAHEYKVTKGERLLRSDKRLGKWRVGRGHESGLRKVWTIIRESIGDEKSKAVETQVVRSQDVEMADQIEAESVKTIINIGTRTRFFKKNSIAWIYIRLPTCTQHTNQSARYSSTILRTKLSPKRVAQYSTTAMGPSSFVKRQVDASSMAGGDHSSIYEDMTPSYVKAIIGPPLEDPFVACTEERNEQATVKNKGLKLKRRRISNDYSTSHLSRKPAKIAKVTKTPMNFSGYPGTAGEIVIPKMVAFEVWLTATKWNLDPSEIFADGGAFDNLAITKSESTIRQWCEFEEFLALERDRVDRKSTWIYLIGE